ncbi:hypothetical protein [Paenibacillus xylaniclasticus]|uniref:hypothetical protein n=1 Tax=Paenibacillus xylaniclasticus TaxID=588083 RepID=UPI000FD88AEE|nr:hypothetical protein [Paenibacillus xylaniclasticus]
MTVRKKTINRPSNGELREDDILKFHVHTNSNYGIYYRDSNDVVHHVATIRNPVIGGRAFFKERVSRRDDGAQAVLAKRATIAANRQRVKESGK